MKNKKLYSLKEFCEIYGQEVAKDIIGVSQGAISQMISNKREVFITQGREGVSYYEVKMPGKSKSKPTLPRNEACKSKKPCDAVKWIYGAWYKCGQHGFVYRWTDDRWVKSSMKLSNYERFNKWDEKS